MLKKEPNITYTIPENVGIQGFCITYTTALIKKLKELKKKDRLFQLGNKNATREGYISHLTSIGKTVMINLYKQLNLPQRGEESSNIYTVEELIRTAEEFVVIFIKGKKKRIL